MAVVTFLLSIVRGFEPRFKFLTSLPTGGTILDCGCGDFVSSDKLREQRPDLDWNCLDLKKPETVPAGITFTLLNLEQERFPFPDECFDGIFLLHVMEHIGNLELLCSELRRVLKINGQLYIEVPSFLAMFAPTSRRFFALTGNFFDDITHKRAFTEVSLNCLAEDHLGLIVTKIGTVRNIAKIAVIPLLIIYSLFTWRAFFMTGVCDLVGLRLFCVGVKEK